MSPASWLAQIYLIPTFKSGLLKKNKGLFAYVFARSLSLVEVAKNHDKRPMITFTLNLPQQQYKHQIQKQNLH